MKQAWLSVTVEAGLWVHGDSYDTILSTFIHV